jgi:hypothetical protein
MMDLLEQIVDSSKLGEREKRKKLKKFKEAYPDVFHKKFPNEESLPVFMKSGSSKKKEGGGVKTNALGKFSSLSRLRNAIRI